MYSGRRSLLGFAFSCAARTSDAAITEQVGENAGARFHVGVGLVERPAVRLHLRGVGPGIADLRRELRIVHHLGAQVGIEFALGGDQRGIDERFLLAVIGLERVLDAEEVFVGDARMFGALLAEEDQAAAQFRQQQQRVGLRHIADGFELLGRQQALRRARIAGDEDRLAILRRGRCAI